MRSFSRIIYKRYLSCWSLLRNRNHNFLYVIVRQPSFSTFAFELEFHMADVHDLGGDGERQNEDDIPILPPGLRTYLGYWHYWYSFIVHRGAHVAPFIIPQYTIDIVTNDIRPAPFPRDISETWYCATLITLIIVVHHGVDKGWLFEEGYPIRNGQGVYWAGFS